MGRGQPRSLASARFAACVASAHVACDSAFDGGFEFTATVGEPSELHVACGGSERVVLPVEAAAQLLDAIVALPDAPVPAKPDVGMLDGMYIGVQVRLGDGPVWTSRSPFHLQDDVPADTFASFVFDLARRHVTRPQVRLGLASVAPYFDRLPVDEVPGQIGVSRVPRTAWWQLDGLVRTLSSGGRDVRTLDIVDFPDDGPADERLAEVIRGLAAAHPSITWVASRSWRPSLSAWGVEPDRIVVAAR